MPVFDGGVPKIREYNDDAALMGLLADCDEAIIVSIDAPLPQWLEADFWETRKFKYGLIATPDTLRRLFTRELVDSCDLYFVRSQHELDSAVKDHSTDYRELLAECERIGADATFYTNLLRPRIGFEWDEETSKSFREKCRITGYPFLDGFEKIDRDAIRKKWDLSEDTPVIGFWATAHHGRGYHGYWDRIFSEPNHLRRILLNLKYYGVDFQKYEIQSEQQVFKQVMKFARKEGAKVFVKLRHYHNAKNCFYVTEADRAIGEESFYPHTGMELAAISDVMMGYRTTGTTEAVHCGSHVVDFVIPGAHREIHYDTLNFLHGLYDCEGVVTSMPYDQVGRRLGQSTLSDFKNEPAAEKAYRTAFCGPQGGSFSSNVVDALELELR